MTWSYTQEMEKQNKTKAIYIQTIQIKKETDQDSSI